MGRQSYLVRLAAGRAAFGPISDTQAESLIEADPSQPYVQRFDTSGRPRNSSTSRIQVSQIRAKNTVLETVGICKRKDKAAGTAAGTCAGTLGLRSVSRWDLIGSLPYLLVLPVRTLANAWKFGLEDRILFGTVDCNAAFVEILQDEWRRTSLRDLTTRYLIAQAAQKTFRSLVTLAQRRLDPLCIAATARLEHRLGLPSDGLWSQRLLRWSRVGLFLISSAMLPLLIYADLVWLGFQSPSCSPWSALTSFRHECSSLPLFCDPGPGRRAASFTVIGLPLFSATALQYLIMYKDIDTATRRSKSSMNSSKQPFLAPTLVELRNRARKMLGWPSRANGTDDFVLHVNSVTRKPLHRLINRLLRWTGTLPARSYYMACVYTTSVWLGRRGNSVLGAGDGANSRSSHSNSMLATFNKIALIDMLFLAADAGMWICMYAATRLMAVGPFQPDRLGWRSSDSGVTDG